MINRLLAPFIFTLLFFHVNTDAKAQGYRQLNVSDFKALPDLNRAFAAYIYWGVNYKYKYVYPTKKMGLDVQLQFLSDKSWFTTTALMKIK